MRECTVTGELYVSVVCGKNDNKDFQISDTQNTIFTKKEFVNKNGEQISYNGYLGKGKSKNYVIYLDGEESSFAYHFTEVYGENQEEYLSLSHYSVTKSNQRDIQKLVNILSYHLTHKSEYAYITHYKKYYQNVPLWILIQLLTLGQFSHMYDYLNAAVPIKVCQDFHNISRKDMHFFLSILTKHRNACAHGDRFLNYITKDSVTDTLIHKKLHIMQKRGRYQCGKTDVFSEVIILKYLLDREDFRNFYYELKFCLKKYCLNPQIITQMGFPENWMSIFRLKL